MAYRYPVKVVNGWPTVVDMGAFRHTIEIQQLTLGGVDEAEPTRVPAVFATAQASIDPYVGSDIVQGGETTGRAKVLVTLWFIPGITTDMQVVSPTGNRYTIEWIENVLELNVVLVLHCLGLGKNAS